MMDRKWMEEHQDRLDREMHERQDRLDGEMRERQDRLDAEMLGPLREKLDKPWWKFWA